MSPNLVKHSTLLPLSEQISKKTRDQLVSVIIPTMNSGRMLVDCLGALERQTWREIETIVVDGHSSDNTIEIAKKYGALTVVYGPEQQIPLQRVFGAPYQWNHGASLARGSYLYLLASDLRLSQPVIENCMTLAERDSFDALIIPEVSYGEGFWSECKRLQRSFFVGDQSIESPMFIRRSVWSRLGGFDPEVGGFVDWDLTNRLIENGYRIGRIQSWAFHYEGRLQLPKLLRKKYMYGKATTRYISKHRKTALTSNNLSRFGLLRPSYVRNFGRIVRNPKVGAGFAIMTASEYFAAALGAASEFLSDLAQKAPSNQ